MGQISKSTLIIIVLLSSTLFALVMATNLPLAAAADAQSGTLFCDKAIKSSSPSNSAKITVDLPIDEVIGGTVTAYATLTDESGSPIIAAPVLFYMDGKRTPPVWIGHAITDCDGVAIIRFTKQDSGPLVLTAKFLGGNGIQPQEITATMELKQLVHNEADVAGMGTIGVTAMVAVIGAAAVMGAVIAIREDKKDELTQQ